MNRTLSWLAIAAAVVFVTLACTFEVQETDYAIVLFFGKPTRIITTAGLGWKLPPPIETRVRIDKRLRVLDPDAAEYLTRDKKNVLADVFAAWEVEDPLKFLVTVVEERTAESQLDDIMRAEVGAALGEHELSDLLSVTGPVKMKEIMDGVTENADTKAREAYGIRVRAIGLKRLNFPEENRQAVFRRMESERERIARQYRSEGEEEAEKIRAEADRQQAELLAEADRRAKEIRGAADAEAARIYAEAYQADPEFYEFLKTLESYESFIDEDATIVLPSDSRLLHLLREPR